MGEVLWASQSALDPDDHLEYDKYGYNKRDCIYDMWDAMYGDGSKDYEAYVLCDGTKPGDFKFGLLQFSWEPFYVGHGIRKRSRKSCWVPYEHLRCPTNFKEKRIREIALKKGHIYMEIIDYYQTKKKASVVERKLMNTIPKKYLTNMLRHYCTLNLHKEDCGYHILVTKMRNKK